MPSAGPASSPTFRPRPEPPPRAAPPGALCCSAPGRVREWRPGPGSAAGSRPPAAPRLAARGDGEGDWGRALRERLPGEPSPDRLQPSAAAEVSVRDARGCDQSSASPGGHESPTGSLSRVGMAVGPVELWAKWSVQ